MLEKCVKAIEQEAEETFTSSSLWEAYEQARVVLGDPVQEYPGGYDDAHFHRYGWKLEDGCETCADWNEDHSCAKS